MDANGIALAAGMLLSSVTLLRMNVHHLELFYYVARYGGITAAVRHMPYGIQQPAVSSQMIALEDNLGVRLFERQPFKLSPEGEELLAFVRPFFDRLDDVGTRLRLRRNQVPQLRIGAAELVLRDHLPTVVQRLKRKHASIRLGLRSGFQAELERAVQDRQVDVAVIPRRGRLSAGIRSLRLVRLPLVLLVPKSSKIRAADELWRHKTVPEPLISLPPNESLPLNFQKGLRRKGVDWPVGLEASSIELITQYVADGHGLGASVMVPDVVRHPMVRALPLPDFDPVELVAMWRGAATGLLRELLVEMQGYAREVWPATACDDELP